MIIDTHRISQTSMIHRIRVFIKTILVLHLNGHGINIPKRINPYGLFYLTNTSLLCILK